MTEARDFSRLWRMIGDSLRPFTKLDMESVTAEREREILLALSQVFRQVQLWNLEGFMDTINDHQREFSAHRSSEFEDIDCQNKIIVDLVCLMTVDSRYVQHLAGNVVLVVSELISQRVSKWKAFVQALCVSLDFSINTLRDSQADYCHKNSSSLTILLSDKLKDANFGVLSGLVRVLRCLLKYLGNKEDARLSRVYFDSVHSCLLRVPYDSFCEIIFASDICLERIVFLGNFIQWLCSVVGASGSSIDTKPVLHFVDVFGPKLLSLNPSEQGFCADKSIDQYFRHKLLALMIRISDQTSLSSSNTISWLHLLRNHFGENLRNPMNTPEPVEDDSLEDSPFLGSFSDEEVKSLSSRNIERRAIFLFLRCSFSLINSKCDTTEKCACQIKNVSLLSSNEELECCARKRGFIELKNWLQCHIPMDSLPSHEMYMQKCVDFSMSFLKLFMHEDDLLFRVLLQLLSVPFPSEEEFQKNKANFRERDIIFHISNLFNHVHLFHLFLAELHYDHQVLLDYLISKDIGISCAEYLLRSLRAVCDSYHSFVEFYVHREIVREPSYKKRKVTNDEGKSYDNAKECLLSLLDSLESLHRKNLFPYNPKVLVKRLKTFQELCCTEEKNSGSSRKP